MYVCMYSMYVCIIIVPFNTDMCSAGRSLGCGQVKWWEGLRDGVFWSTGQWPPNTHAPPNPSGPPNSHGPPNPYAPPSHPQACAHPSLPPYR